MTEALDKTNVITGLEHPVRGSFVHVFEKHLNKQSGEEAYSMQLLIPKKDKDTIAKIQQAVKEAIKKEFGSKPPDVFRNPLRDGDKTGPGGVPPKVKAGSEPYGDHYFMNVKNSRKPQIVDQNKQHIIDENLFTSGDYCRVHINAYGFRTGGDGVSFGLNSIQVVRKGEPLDGRVDADEVFGTVEAEDQDETEGDSNDPFA